MGNMFAETSVKAEMDRLEKGIGTYFDLVVVLTQLVDVAYYHNINFRIALAEAQQSAMKMREHDA